MSLSPIDIEDIKRMYEENNFGEFDIKDIQRKGFQVMNAQQHSAIEECLNTIEKTADISLDSGIKIHLPWDASSESLLKDILNYIKTGDITGFKILYGFPYNYPKTITIYILSQNIFPLSRKDLRFKLSESGLGAEYKDNRRYKVDISRIMTDSGWVGRISFSLRERPTVWEPIEKKLRKAFDEAYDKEEPQVFLLSRDAIGEIETGYKFDPKSETPVYIGVVPIPIEKMISEIVRKSCLRAANILQSNILATLEELGRGSEIQRTSIYLPALIEEKRRRSSIIALTPAGRYNFSLDNFSRYPENLYKIYQLPMDVFPL